MPKKLSASCPVKVTITCGRCGNEYSYRHPGFGRRRKFCDHCTKHSGRARQYDVLKVKGRTVTREKTDTAHRNYKLMLEAPDIVRRAIQSGIIQRSILQDANRIVQAARSAGCLAACNRS